MGEFLNSEQLGRVPDQMTAIKSKPVRPVLVWPGGKRRMLKHLLPRVASIPHVCYVEAFAGGIALLLAKERSQVEIVNDFNGDLVSLYRCAQFHLEALEKEVAMTLFSRRNVVDFQRERGLTELQRAARFLLLNRMSFGGGMKSYAVVRGTSARVLFLEPPPPRMLRDLQQRCLRCQGHPFLP